MAAGRLRQPRCGALARSFPGGWREFQYAMRALLKQMQLFSFDFGDSSGLSAFNRASAHDRSVSLLGGKTGFAAAAGYCLAMAEEFGGQVFALAVLNSRDREARAQDMNLLRQFTRQSLAAVPGEMIRR